MSKVINWWWTGADSWAWCLCWLSCWRSNDQRHFWWPKEAPYNWYCKSKKEVETRKLLTWLLSCQLVNIIAVFLSRRDACWTCKSIFHGWDINWFRQLHNFPNCQFYQAIHSHSQWNSHSFSSSTSTRNFWTLWWHCTPLRWVHCISGSSPACSWILWNNGL